MTFETDVINATVDKLLQGKDYRDEVIKAINAKFLDFTMGFFKNIVNAKMNDKRITLDWYKDNFINSSNHTADEAAIFAGLNKKTITNIYKHATKDIVLKVANDNFEYLSNLIGAMENDENTDLAVSIKINYKKDAVKLSLTESLLVINALATKKMQLRGGAWSSIGKKVEKPLIDKLCSLAGVPSANIDRSTFKKDKTKSFDREVDYKLISKNGKIYRIEVKLMGKGNPESADATIARDSDIFVADTLSTQNCNQLQSRGVDYLVLKDNNNVLANFKQILKKRNIPFTNK